MHTNRYQGLRCIVCLVRKTVRHYNKYTTKIYITDTKIVKVLRWDFLNPLPPRRDWHFTSPYNIPTANRPREYSNFFRHCYLDLTPNFFNLFLHGNTKQLKRRINKQIQVYAENILLTLQLGRALWITAV